MTEFRPIAVALALLLLSCGLAGCWSAWDGEENAAPAYRGSDPFATDEESEPPGGASDDDDDDDAGSDDDDDLGGDSQSEVAIVALDPEPDSSGHHYRRPITITFDGDASGTMVRVVGPSEESDEHELPLLPQQWSENGTRLEVLPSMFLFPESLYRVTIEQNDSVLEYSFTTSSTGLPIDSGVTLDGRTYSVVPADGVAVSPPALGTLLSASSPGLTWLWQLHLDASADELSIDTGLASVDGAQVAQDACTPTTGLLPAGVGLTLSDAYFANSPDRLNFWLGDGLLELEQAEVSGDISPDGSSLEEVAVSGWLVTGSLAQLIGDDLVGSTASVSPCNWAKEQLGVSCETCPSGGQGCVWVHVASLSGSLQAAPMQEVGPLAALPCDGDNAFDAALSCALGGNAALPHRWLLLLPPLLVLGRRFRST